MVTEVALIAIRPGEGPAFEAAVAQAAPVFRAARGCLGMSLERTVEQPELYRLVVRWATLEDHTVHFRGSEGFQQWRALAGPYFASAPEVRHVVEISRYFG